MLESLFISLLFTCFIIKFHHFNISSLIKLCLNSLQFKIRLLLNMLLNYRSAKLYGLADIRFPFDMLKLPSSKAISAHSITIIMLRNYRPTNSFTYKKAFSRPSEHEEYTFFFANHFLSYISIEYPKSRPQG